jgi:hypothetical protein
MDASDIAKRIIRGDLQIDRDMRRQLEFQGYNMKDIQKEVNRRISCPNRHGW